MFRSKKSGKVHMCIDYHVLPCNTVKFAYPMPHIEPLLERLRVYKVVRLCSVAVGTQGGLGLFDRVYRGSVFTPIMCNIITIMVGHGDGRMRYRQ